MRNYIFILVYVFIISAPVVISFFVNSLANDNKENRKLALKPKLVFNETRKNTGVKKVLSLFDDIKNYAKKFEKYYTDNFILKPKMFEAYCFIQSNIFNANSISGKVVEGEEGWLFVGDDYSKSIKESKNIINFQEEELTLLQKKLKSWKSWFFKNKIDFYIGVPPNKLSIYGEFLPITKNTSQPKKAEQLSLLCNKLGVNHINMLEGVVSNTNERLFPKSDSHWNDTGAYLGYKNLMGKMQLEYPQLEIIPKDQITEKMKIAQEQDLSRMLLKKVEEEVTTYKLKNPKAKKVENRLAPKGNRANPKTYELRFKSDVNDLKVLIFRDSFSNALIKYISESFGESVFIWNIKLDKEIILQEKPDIVISICVERSIDVFKFI